MLPSYPFKLAFDGMWREKWINLLSVLTIAAGLFIITVGFLVFYNAKLITEKLPGSFSVTIFLKEGISDKETLTIINALKKNPSVEEIKYISSESALKELKAALKDADYILEGLEGNPLPASIELKLKKESVKTSSVKNLSFELKKISGIEDVLYGEKFLSSIQAIMSGVQSVGLIFMTLLASGIIFVCYSTVKILFYRKADEIETIKLLGATKWFIRAPFLIEGGTIGTAGGLFSACAAAALYYFIYYRAAAVLPVLQSIVMPHETFFILPLAGLFIGITGAAIALGRIRF